MFNLKFLNNPLLKMELIHFYTDPHDLSSCKDIQTSVDR